MDKREIFDRTYKNQYAKFFYFAYQRVGDEENAKDIVNDVFEFYWANIDKTESDTTVPYLWSVLRTKCIDHLRKMKVHENYIEYTKALTTPITQQSDDEREERLTRIEAAMENLTPYVRSILIACFIHKKKYKEVAEENNVTVAAIHKNIVKALRRIREEIAEDR